MKKTMSMFLAIIMCLSLCTPAFATAPDDTPPWVEEGETWYPSNDIMLLEDFGDCPEGHRPPSGYHYEGYTMGQASSHYDDLALAITIGSIATRNPLVIEIGSLSAAVLNWLHGKEDPDLTYFKYVYTKGSSTFYHIIYSIDNGRGEYLYITCETYYG